VDADCLTIVFRAHGKVETMMRCVTCQWEKKRGRFLWIVRCLFTSVRFHDDKLMRRDMIVGLIPDGLILTSYF